MVESWRSTAGGGSGGCGSCGGREESREGPQPRHDVGGQLRVGQHVRDEAVSLSHRRQVDRRLPSAPTALLLMLLMLLLLLLLMLVLLLLVMMVMVTGLKSKRSHMKT